jgi:glycosyltransferase involved in cell wall biosynthesis
MNRAEAAGAAGHVFFGEAVTDIEKAVKSHDLVLNMSESESFSFVCLEAVKYGVPLVAADSGGPAEITGNGTKAALVSNRDPQAAAEAISRMLHQPHEAIQLAAEAKSWAHRFFDPVIAREKLARLYQSLV